MPNAAVESGTRTNGDVAPANTIVGAPIAEYVVRVRPCADGFTATLRRSAVDGELEVRAIAGPIGMGVASTAAEAMAEAIANTAMPGTPNGTRFPDEFDPPTL